MSIEIRLSHALDPRVARFVRSTVGGVLNACDPYSLMAAVDLSKFGPRTHVLGFGKASSGMVQRCVDELGSRCAGGVVLAPDEMIPDDTRGTGLHWFGVDHPAPTPRNVRATQHLIQYARGIPDTDDCLVCLSGGGSAHLCSPREGVTLEEIIERIRSLNARGAPIHEINQSRRMLETLKGGGLARLLRHVRRCQVIVLSDVLDDDLSTIASGPMLCPEFPIDHTIIGNHRTALDAIERVLGDLGIRACTKTSRVSGNSSAVGAELASRFVDDLQRGIHLIAGETTVDAQGCTGVGGPTLETVLSAAIELGLQDQVRQIPDWVVLGLTTDGIDGPSGAAGAVMTSDMLGKEQLQSAQRALGNHDSLNWLDSVGGVIRTGPTGTNMNDVAFVGAIDLAQGMS